MEHDPKEKRPERRGIVDPVVLRSVLDEFDTTMTQVLVLRARYHDRVQDAFTCLRSSSQIFRELFYRVELPVKNVKDLVNRAGGPLRLIRVSYPTLGSRLFALADIVAAIPKFDTVFPVENLFILGEKLEELREKVHGDGPWFVLDIENKHLKEALAHAKKTGGLNYLLDPKTRLDPCADRPQPAACVERCLTQIELNVPTERWTGRGAYNPKSTAKTG